MSSTREQPVPPRPPVSIKGRGRDIRVTVERAGAPASVEASLRDQLKVRAGAFFSGAPVTLELPGPAIDFALAEALTAAIEQAGMVVAAVTVGPATDGAARPAARSEAAGRAPSTSPMGRTRASGTGAGIPGSEAAARAGALDAAAPTTALVVERTLRSGQRLEHPGDVILIGDVNPGAELVAGGSVVVWGRLRGTVEAGAGRAGAFVCALDLAPSQLLIGSAIARAPDDPTRDPAPEIARESGGRIEVEEWR